jgi:hypothetical protein
MDATRSEREFLYEVLAVAIECGATSLTSPTQWVIARPPRSPIDPRHPRHTPGIEKASSRYTAITICAWP